MFPVRAEGYGEPLPEPIERHIVITRHYQRGDRQAVDKGSGLAELIRLGPLGQIARKSHQIWSPLFDQLEHPTRQLLQMGWSEMNV